MNKHKGFTILELVVIITVIAILAAIATIGLNIYLVDGRDSQRESRTTAIASYLERYYEANNEYPSCAALSAAASTVSTSTLKGIDTAALVTPKAGSGVTNSVACDGTPSASDDFFLYECAGTTYCTNFELTYYEESSKTTKTVASKRGGSGVANIATVSSLAGSGSNGYGEGTGTGASFGEPVGIVVGTSGDIFIADTYNHRIRKVTPAGTSSTLAGNGGWGGGWGFTNGTGTGATFNGPTDVAIDSSGNVFVADTSNNVIRRVTPAGVTTTFAGSTSGATGTTNATGTSARFNQPAGIAIDSSNNLYVADAGNHRIRKITSGAVVTTLAGSSSGWVDATGTSARFNSPQGITVDSSGTVYVADTNNHAIRKITAAGVVTSLAGDDGYGYEDSTGDDAEFYSPRAIDVASNGDLYVADTMNNVIRLVTQAGVVTTVAGTGSNGHVNGPANVAQFFHPRGVALASDGTLFVTDGHYLRKITF